ELSVQQLVGIAFNSNSPLDGLPSTVLVPHPLHLDRQLNELIANVPSRLLMCTSHPVVEPGKLIIPALGHLSELTARLPQGKAIAGSVGATFLGRHQYLDPLLK